MLYDVCNLNIKQIPGVTVGGNQHGVHEVAQAILHDNDSQPFRRPAETSEREILRNRIVLAIATSREQFARRAPRVGSTPR